MNMRTFKIGILLSLLAITFQVSFATDVGSNKASPQIEQAMSYAYGVTMVYEMPTVYVINPTQTVSGYAVTASENVSMPKIEQGVVLYSQTLFYSQDRWVDIYNRLLLKPIKESYNYPIRC